MSAIHKRHSASSSKLVSRLKALDAYPKINEDFFTRTLSGGIITIVSSVIMLLLFISELRKCGMSAHAHQRWLACAVPTPSTLLQGYTGAST
jgi:hypothetical protein